MERRLGASAASGGQGTALGLATASAAGQAGPRLAGPAGWLRRLGQGGLVQGRRGAG